MKNRIMLHRGVLLLGLLVVAIGCSKDDGDETLVDYRFQYEGIYECTKSTRSFEDETFRVDIDDIVIEIPMDTDSMITLDGTQLLIQEDGSTGWVNVAGTSYDLLFEGSSFKLKSSEIVLGFAATCYIIGEKK